MVKARRFHRHVAVAACVAGFLAAPGMFLRSSSPSTPGELVAGSAPSASTEPGFLARMERDGIAISLDLVASSGGAPKAYEDATFTFTLTDAKTSAPLTGRRLFAWMSVRNGANAPDDAACRGMIRNFVAGLLSAQPDVNLNAHRLLALADDRTLSIINSQLAFTRTKVRNVATLPGDPADWGIHPRLNLAYVTIPAAGVVSIVDTARGLVIGNVPVGQRPTRIAVAPDGRSIWVGNDGDSSVSVLDTNTNNVLHTLKTGRGHHEIVFADEGRYVFIANEDSSTLTVIDTADTENVGAIEVGEGIVSLDVSSIAGAVYAANEKAGEIAVVHKATRSIARRIDVGRGVSHVRFDPDGRFAVALNPFRGEVLIIDASAGRVIHTLSRFAEPDAVAFTETFVYVHERGTNEVSLIRRKSLGAMAAPEIIRIPIGQKAPGNARAPFAASPFAITPEGDQVVIANPADKALYHYVEGMMAPVSTYLVHGRAPIGVLAVDQSLKETRPGVYSTTARLGGAGLHDVAWLVEEPRVTGCLEMTVRGSGAPGPEDVPRVAFEPLFERNARLPVNETSHLRFRIYDPLSSEPIDAKEIAVMIFRYPGNFQVRPPVEVVGEGVFEVEFTPARTGQYRFLVADEARGTPFGKLRFVNLSVFDPSTQSSYSKATNQEGSRR